MSFYTRPSDKVHQHVRKANGQRLEASHPITRGTGTFWEELYSQPLKNRGSRGGKLGDRGQSHRMLADEVHRGYVAFRFPAERLWVVIYAE